MFSGIVEEKGEISALSEGKGHLTLTVNCSESFSKDKKIGDSVSVDGVCLTVTKKTNDTLTFDAVKETLERTIIGNYIDGSCVNLESSLTFGGSVTANTTTFALVDKNTNIYNYVLWTSCDEPFSDSIGDKGNYIARISLWHYDLRQLSWANERNKKNKKKKEF